jgi:hypothetical protein
MDPELNIYSSGRKMNSLYKKLYFMLIISFSLGCLFVFVLDRIFISDFDTREECLQAELGKVKTQPELAAVNRKFNHLPPLTRVECNVRLGAPPKGIEAYLSLNKSPSLQHSSVEAYSSNQEQDFGGIVIAIRYKDSTVREYVVPFEHRLTSSSTQKGFFQVFGPDLMKEMDSWLISDAILCR